MGNSNCLERRSKYFQSKFPDSLIPIENTETLDDFFTLPKALKNIIFDYLKFSDTFIITERIYVCDRDGSTVRRVKFISVVDCPLPSKTEKYYSHYTGKNVFEKYCERIFKSDQLIDLTLPVYILFEYSGFMRGSSEYVVKISNENIDKEKNTTFYTEYGRGHFCKKEMFELNHNNLEVHNDDLWEDSKFKI